MKRRPRVWAAGAALACCVTVQAQHLPDPQCQPPFIETVGELQAVDQALAVQLQRLPQCQHHAPWLAAVGVVLNRLGRYAQAAEYLERALLLDPQQASVQIEYAVALAGSADLLSALQLLQTLRTDSKLAPELRQAVEVQIARWTETALGDANTSRAYVLARLGHDSNLLGTPNLGSLTLTLPGQTLQLPLDESYLSRPGIYRRVDAGWAARHGTWLAAVNASGRDSPQEPGAATQQIQAMGEYTGHRHYANATAAYLQSRAGTRYRALGLSAGLQWEGGGPTHACRGRSGLEWQQRTLANSPGLSGHYGGILWQRTCDTGANAAQKSALGAWQISVRWGRDVPAETERPGGAQEQAGLRLLALGTGWAPRHEWLLDAELFHQQDTRGYSALLQDNARRQLTRVALRAEYAMPLSPASAWQLILGAEWQRQRSNLPLFQQESQGGYLALRHQW